MKLTLITPVYCPRYAVGPFMETLRKVHGEHEHIVIDGGSGDETLSTLKRYRSALTRILSEPDRGPYDAMNKGIRIARGEIIGILNADDFYPEPDILDAVVRAMDLAGADSCYGDLEYAGRDNPERVIRRWKAGPYDRSRWYLGWMPPHPTFFVRRRLYEELGLYRLDLGTSADYELMLRFLFKNRISTVYIPRVLVRMRAGGMSNRSLWGRVQANLTDRKAWKVNGLRPRPWTLWMKPLSKAGQFLPWNFGLCTDRQTS